MPLDLYIDLFVAYWHLKSINYVIDKVHIGKNDLIQIFPHVGNVEALLEFIEKSDRSFVTSQESVLKSLDKVLPQVKAFYTQVLYENSSLTEKLHYRLYNYFKPSAKTEKPQ